MEDEIEEITPEMYRGAQKNYMNSKEGFLSNLKKSYLGRVKEVGTLGKEHEELPYPASFGGQLGQIIGRSAIDVPAMTAAILLGPAGLPLLGAYGYVTSPGETSADKLEQALFTAAPMGLGKAKPKIQNMINNVKGATEMPGSFSSLKNMFETIKKPGVIQENIDVLKEEITGSNLSKKQKTDTLLSEIEPAYANKEKQTHDLEQVIENKLGE